VEKKSAFQAEKSTFCIARKINSFGQPKIRAGYKKMCCILKS